MGTKLREKDITSSGTTQTDYCGNVIYNNMTPTILLTDNGYVTLSDSKYHFYYKDHEGNNRVVADQSNTVEQVNNYYPFGLSYKNDAITNVNRYKYNGKELQTMHGFDWYDYGARFYDPEICQWHAMDPACEKYYDISPYVYCVDEPIRHIDIFGKDEWDIDQETGRMIKNTATKLYDAFFIVNNKGERIKGESLIMTYGSISGYHTLNDEKGEVAYYSVSNNNAKKTFEFLAKNTKVEWTNTQMGHYDNARTSYLSTGFNYLSESGASYLVNKRIIDVENIETMSHSHPNNMPYPSGLGTKPFGDMLFARQIEEVTGHKVYLNIYIPSLDKYIPYSKESTEYDFMATSGGVTITN